MGGYGSGRRKRHHVTDECLAIDTSRLLKHGFLTSDKRETGGELNYIAKSSDAKEKNTEAHHNLYFTIDRYGDEEGEFSRWDAAGHITLIYGCRQGENNKTCSLDIPLVVTHPNYGGVRWWYLAPCCGKRVRVLYLPLYGSLEQCIPECRQCLHLNYASQRQSYIERHKTYERYLLSNYGYTWAELEYDSLSEHHLQLTPELEYIRQQSILTRELELLRHLISFHRSLLRTHIQAICSLKSPEDRQIYFGHLVENRGSAYALDLVNMLKISLQVERDAYELSDAVFEQVYMQAASQEEANQETTGQSPLNLQNMIARKEALEEELRHLEQQKDAA